MPGITLRQMDHAVWWYVYLHCLFIYVYIFLQNKGKEIKWAHLVELAEKASSDTDLYISKKLKREHLKLTSYSRMNARLAVQVNYAILLKCVYIEILGFELICC